MRSDGSPALFPADTIARALTQSAAGASSASPLRVVLGSAGPSSQTSETDSAALINLLENAYKYSEELKHILLRARANNGSVMFSVTDNGVGITPRERRRIFEPFYQVDQRLSRKGGGCGLGLSIVQFITTAHHGSVSVESQPGCGSTFTLSLPVGSGATRIRKEAIA